MDIIIQSVGFNSSDQLEGLIREKLGKIDHKLHDIVRADVTFFLGADGERDNKYCEIRLEVPGDDLFVKKNAESFEAAIAEALNALNNLIGKRKGKQLENRP